MGEHAGRRNDMIKARTRQSFQSEYSLFSPTPEMHHSPVLETLLLHEDRQVCASEQRT